MSEGTALVEARGAAGEAADVVAFAGDAETLDTLRACLDGAGVVVRRGRVDDAARYLLSAARAPRLLIVDVSGYETPLGEIDRLAEVCEPSVVVVVIGESESVHLFRELLRAGVADYITKPVSPELLEPYVRERRSAIAAGPAKTRRGRLVAFAGARGGVGVTTLAVATAWRLSQVHKRRVALVDLDLHGGGACVQLGVQPGGLLEALENHQRLDSLFLDRTLIAAAPRLSVLAEQIPLRRDAAPDPVAAQAVLDLLARDFHYVVVDAPRGFGAACAQVFANARSRVVVADRTLPGLRDAARLLEIEPAGPAATTIVINDHQPGLRQIVKTATIAKALGAAPDIEIDYDRTAARRGDNMGEALGEGRGPLAAAAERIADLIGNRRIGAGRPARRLFGLIGGRT